MSPRDKKSAKATKPKKQKKKIDITESAADFLSDIRYGQSVSVNFFKANAWLLITFVVVVLALMGMRYKTKTKMEQIKALEKELVQSESDKLREKAAYMSLIRETEMLRLVRDNHLGLIFQEQPPYDIQLLENANN